MREIYVKIKEFLVERLSLSGDTDYENNTIEAVKRGVAFKGVNLWTLIFATFIASIGFNVNSTAVIIGAMLISPALWARYSAPGLEPLSTISNDKEFSE